MYGAESIVDLLLKAVVGEGSQRLGPAVVSRVGIGSLPESCPITRCAKRLLNGPCGGSQDGKCEVNAEVECAWQRIYDRASTLGIPNRLEPIAAPQDWSKRSDGGPRKVIREDQRIAERGPTA